jgi:hypothetical protein
MEAGRRRLVVCFVSIFQLPTSLGFEGKIVSPKIFHSILENYSSIFTLFVNDLPA